MEWNVCLYLEVSIRFGTSSNIHYSTRKKSLLWVYSFCERLETFLLPRFHDQCNRSLGLNIFSFEQLQDECNIRTIVEVLKYYFYCKCCGIVEIGSFFLLHIIRSSKGQNWFPFKKEYIEKVTQSLNVSFQDFNLFDKSL